MNNRLPERIMYALGCALVLSLHSLTPRSTSAQLSETDASAREHTGAVASPSATPARATEHTIDVAPRAVPSLPNHGVPDLASNAGPARGTGAGTPTSARDTHANADPVSSSATLARATQSAGNTAPSVTPAHAAAHARAPAREQANGGGARGTPNESAGVVNLNTATAAELERLPRVGPARAQAILALRAQVTRFSKVEQLLRVKGIGRATFRKLRPMLALEGPTTLPERRVR